MTGSAPKQPGLHLFTSNRLESLADKLAACMRPPPGSPFLPEIIVVRNKGMERWLKLQLAERLGVCACCEFPFPETFAQRVFRAVLPHLEKEPPLDCETLAWRIAQVLPELKDRPDFAPVRRYLGGDGEAEDERKLIQLAGRLANLFDQYVVFRPELILHWEAGHDPQWQAQLWRAVSADARQRHAAGHWRQFERAVLDPQLGMPGIPERVSVFGVSALAPFYIGLLAGLSSHRQVNLFLLQPSQEYWGDITSPREEERIIRRRNRPDGAAFELHLEPGNRLLASLGYLGRDFLKLLLGAGDWQCEESFAEPGEDSLLHCIQSDILHLRDRGRTAPVVAPGPIAAADSSTLTLHQPDLFQDAVRRVPGPPAETERARAEAERTPVALSDDSVQIHSFHSPLREMEALYDRMLDWFACDPGLAPRDIVVMMPNVETYAPFIQAVFGSPEHESKRIPFDLADRGARRQSQVIDTFLELLALPDTRLGSATVLAPLEAPAVRERFGLSESELETIREWVRDANIRWGIDAAHRERLGLPAFAGHTWTAGIDRLLLGHAMAGRGERLFAAILPLDDIEGDAARHAGHLAQYVERVFQFVEALGERRRLDEWADLLDGALDTFFAVSEDSERELQIIRGQLEALRRQQRDARFTCPIGRAALLERFVPVLDDDLHNAGFLTGRVTFCGFKPMRSIPFRIVCLVGMNDGAFPRPTPRLSFDLMAQDPRLGDRSTREDDRYLFLETLLSARDRLYISHVGQSMKDNSLAPPSVLVSELLDYVEQGFTLDLGTRRIGSARTEPGVPIRGEQEPGPPTLRGHLVTRHRLQAFHEDYFNGAHPQFFSYSTANCRASVSARDARRRITAFLDCPLAEPGPEFRSVALGDLVRFFFNPAKFFLRQRLGIALANTPEELEEREPVLLDGLGQYYVRADILKRRLGGQTVSASRPFGEASGELPPGSVGQVSFAQCAFRAEPFAARVEQIRIAPPLPSDLAVSIGDFQLTGRVRERTAAGPLIFRCGSLRARDLLGAWLEHLAANCFRPGQKTTLLCEDTHSEFAPPAAAEPLLVTLLELYWQGLRAPLKFFPEAALEFAKAERSGRSVNSDPPFEKARKAWNGDRYQNLKGEREDAAFELCFRHEEAIDESFAAHARAIFGPVLAHETRSQT